MHAVRSKREHGVDHRRKDHLDDFASSSVHCRWNHRDNRHFSLEEVQLHLQKALPARLCDFLVFAHRGRISDPLSLRLYRFHGLDRVPQRLDSRVLQSRG